MAIQVRHYGVITGRKIHLYNLPLYQKNADALEGKRIEFTIKEVHETPTSDQHAYYRGGVIETGLTAECFGGWEADELDAYFCDKYLGYSIHKIIQGKGAMAKTVTIRKVTSKADLTMKEMAEFTEKCIAELAQEGVVVLTPAQYKLIKYKTIYTHE